MEWYSIILLLFGGMVFVLLTGLPIAFSLLVVNMVAAYFFLGGIPGIVNVVTSAFTSASTFTLLPVPFFIFMGELIFHSGLGLDAVNVLDKWLGKYPRQTLDPGHHYGGHHRCSERLHHCDLRPSRHHPPS